MYDSRPAGFVPKARLQWSDPLICAHPCCSRTGGQALTSSLQIPQRFLQDRAGIFLLRAFPDGAGSFGAHIAKGHQSFDRI